MPQGHVVRDHYYTRVMADSNSDNKTTCLSFLSDMMIACSVLTTPLSRYWNNSRCSLDAIAHPCQAPAVIHNDW